MSKINLSPCIISWARFALEIKTDKPINSKKCSEKYWKRVINYLVVLYPECTKNKKIAYGKFYYVKK